MMKGQCHQVTLSQAYYLGKYEVTQGQWQAVMGRQSVAFLQRAAGIVRWSGCRGRMPKDLSRS